MNREIAHRPHNFVELPTTRRALSKQRTRERLLAKSSAEWLALFAANGIWAGPVYGYKELLADPQVRHNGSFIEYDHPTEGHIKAPGFPYRFSKTPPSVELGAPLAGEDTREVLQGLGYDEARIDDLLARGVVGETRV